MSHPITPAKPSSKASPTKRPDSADQVARDTVVQATQKLRARLPEVAPTITFPEYLVGRSGVMPVGAIGSIEETEINTMMRRSVASSPTLDKTPTGGVRAIGITQIQSREYTELVERRYSALGSKPNFLDLTRSRINQQNLHDFALEHIFRIIEAKKPSRIVQQDKLDDVSVKVVQLQAGSDATRPTYIEANSSPLREQIYANLLSCAEAELKLMDVAIEIKVTNDSVKNALQALTPESDLITSSGGGAASKTIVIPIGDPERITVAPTHAPSAAGPDSRIIQPTECPAFFNALGQIVEQELARELAETLEAVHGKFGKPQTHQATSQSSSPRDLTPQEMMEYIVRNYRELVATSATLTETQDSDNLLVERLLGTKPMTEKTDLLNSLINALALQALNSGIVDEGLDSNTESILRTSAKQKLKTQLLGSGASGSPTQRGGTSPETIAAALISFIEVENSLTKPHSIKRRNDTEVNVAKTLAANRSICALSLLKDVLEDDASKESPKIVSSFEAISEARRLANEFIFRDKIPKSTLRAHGRSQLARGAVVAVAL
jgi:hypothetical protein